MTVRAWITISVVLLVALTVATVAFFLRPSRPPELLASVPDARLEGSLVASCWPQRGGGLGCTEERPPAEQEPPVIPRAGDIRVIAAFPIQPEDGSARIVDAGTGREEASVDGWKERIAYELPPGRWRLEAEARYPEGAYVRYSFPFRTDDRSTRRSSGGGGGS